MLVNSLFLAWPHFYFLFLGLPLTPRQCALVSLVSGAYWGFRECENRSGRYVCLSIDLNNPERPVALLKASQAVKTLRNLLRSPPASLALAFALDLPHSEAVAPLPVEVSQAPGGLNGQSIK